MVKNVLTKRVLYSLFLLSSTLNTISGAVVSEGVYEGAISRLNSNQIFVFQDVLKSAVSVSGSGQRIIQEDKQ